MSDNLEELKPCPFCGKNEGIVIDDYALDLFKSCSGYFQVVCDASSENNHKGCGSSCGFHPTKELAIQAWNNRAE